MKIRMPILFILLIGGALLVWLFGSARHKTQATLHPSPSEQLDELTELGRLKHATTARYTDFAATAESEQNAGAVRLFRTLAFSDQVHEINCAEAVRRLGGRYAPPLKIVVFRGPTSANLARVLEGELRHYDFYRSGRIERALRAGNRYAARTLIRIAGGDMRQIELLEQFIRHPDKAGYAVCPNCGNIWRSDRCAPYCPFCLTSENAFVRF